MTSTDIGTEVERLRITMSEPAAPPPLRDFASLFESIESLLFVGAVLSRIDPDDTEKNLQEGLLISPDVLVASHFIATNGFRVSRVRYNSPIDILLWIGAGVLTTGVPTSYLALRKVMKLFNETSDARIKFAEARIKEADARIKESDAAVLTALNNRTLHALSTARPGSNLDRVDRDPVERGAFEKPIRKRVEEAASVLANAERIAIEREH